MVIDRQSINAILDRLRNYVRDIETFKAETPRQAFQSDVRRQYQILFPLQQAIQCCVDVAHHLAAELSLDRPHDLGEVFLTLARRQVLSQEFAERLVRMARFRNLIVHGYGRVDMDRAYDILERDLGDFSEFEKRVVEFLGTLARKEDA